MRTLGLLRTLGDGAAQTVWMPQIPALVELTKAIEEDQKTINEIHRIAAEDVEGASPLSVVVADKERVLQGALALMPELENALKEAEHVVAKLSALQFCFSDLEHPMRHTVPEEFTKSVDYAKMESHELFREILARRYPPRENKPWRRLDDTGVEVSQRAYVETSDGAHHQERMEPHDALGAPFDEKVTEPQT